MFTHQYSSRFSLSISQVGLILSVAETSLSLFFPMSPFRMTVTVSTLYFSLRFYTFHLSLNQYSQLLHYCFAHVSKFQVVMIGVYASYLSPFENPNHFSEICYFLMSPKLWKETFLKTDGLQKWQINMMQNTAERAPLQTLQDKQSHLLPFPKHLVAIQRRLRVGLLMLTQ